MKKLILSLCLSAFWFASFAQIKDTTGAGAIGIHVRGSEAMYPVMKDLAAAYNKLGRGYNVVVHADGVGSTLGILSLIEGHSQLCVTSRRITDSEKEESKRFGKDFMEILFAQEAFVILANKLNPVYKLTKDQVGAIFSGKITNWHEVGGENESIRVFIRSNTSGSYLVFKEMFFEGNGLSYSDNALMMKTNLDVKNHITKFKNGISFIGYSSYLANNKHTTLKAIRIGSDSKTTFEPNEETIKSGNYDLIRDTFLYYNSSSYSLLKDFLEFVNSQAGKAIVSNNDLLPGGLVKQP